MKKLRIIPLILIALAGCSNNPGDSSTYQSSKISQPSTFSDYSDYVFTTIEPYRPLTSGAPEELLGLGNDDLVRLSLESPKGPEDCAPLLGRHIEGTINSASSASDACRAGMEHYTNGYNTATDSKVVLESEFFYIVNVSWDYNDHGLARKYDADAFCFKEEFVHLTTDGCYYPFSMTIRDFSSAKTLLDLHEYQRNSTMNGWVLKCSEIEEKENNYLYHGYVIKTCYGDWGVRDEIKLVKRTFSIAKEDGTVTYLGEKDLQTAYGKMN